jgi:hypothetical protein
MRKKRVIRIAAMACLIAVLTTAGCGTTTVTAQDLGRCILDDASPQMLTDIGAQSLGSVVPPVLSRLSGWGCAGALVMARDSDFRREVSASFHQLAPARVEYRRGQYRGISGVPGTALAQGNAEELGLLLEQVQHTRRDVIKCRLADPQSVALVGELDATFALATMGRHVGVDEFDTAKTAAAMILELSAANAMLIPAGQCGDTLEQTFKGHVVSWSQFYSGQHPWAPGCTVTSDEETFVLKCA